MAEISMFFDAEEIVDNSGNITYSPSYDASEFSDYFASFIGNGVFAQPADQLKVIAKEGLTITVKAGKAWIEGHMYKLTEDMDIAISPNVTTSAQQIKVVCVLLRNEDKVKVQVVQGAESLLPVNDGTKHELVLATFNLTVGGASVTNAMITDRRPDNQYCGFVAGVVQQIQTSDLFSQYDSMFNEWFSGVKQDMADFDVSAVVQELNGIREELQRIGAKFSQISLGTYTVNIRRYQNQTSGTNEGVSYYDAMIGSVNVGTRRYMSDPWLNILNGEISEGIYLLDLEAFLYDMYTDNTQLSEIGTTSSGDKFLARGTCSTIRMQARMILKKSGESDLITTRTDEAGGGVTMLKKGQYSDSGWNVTSTVIGCRTFVLVVPKGYTCDEIGISVDFALEFPYNSAASYAHPVLMDVSGYLSAKALIKIL